MLVSARKIFANRQNAQKSTGPKDCAIVKFNALKHGLRSANVIIPGEDPELLEEIKITVYDYYNPDNLLESQIADRIILCAWKLLRAARAEQAILNESKDLEKKIQWRSVLDMDYLEKIARYDQGAENSLYRNMDALARLQERKIKDKKNGAE